MKPKRLACSFCDRSFNRYKALRQHHAEMHGCRPMPKPPLTAPPDGETEADRHIDYLIRGRR